MTDLSSLIARLIAELERAEGGSPRLNAEIEWALTGLQPPDRHKVRPYTTSLDAALSLVPEGCSWTVDVVQASDGPNSQAVIGGRGQDKPSGLGIGPTPALALCIAALRARQS